MSNTSANIRVDTELGRLRLSKNLKLPEIRRRLKEDYPEVPDLSAGSFGNYLVGRHHLPRYLIKPLAEIFGISENELRGISERSYIQYHKQIHSKHQKIIKSTTPNTFLDTKLGCIISNACKNDDCETIQKLAERFNLPPTVARAIRDVTGLCPTSSRAEFCKWLGISEDYYINLYMKAQPVVKARRSSGTIATAKRLSNSTAYNTITPKPEPNFNIKYILPDNSFNTISLTLRKPTEYSAKDHFRDALFKVAYQAMPENDFLALVSNFNSFSLDDLREICLPLLYIDKALSLSLIAYVMEVRNL